MQLANNNDSAVMFRDAVNRAFSFGLSSTGCIFTKVIRLLVKYRRSCGIPVDGWVFDIFQMCYSLQHTRDKVFVKISLKSGKWNVRISCSTEEIKKPVFKKTLENNVSERKLSFIV